MKTAVTIDDQVEWKMYLTEQFKMINPDLKFIGSSSTCNKGLSLIEQEKPNLVFINFKLCEGNLEQLLACKIQYCFEVIFLSNFDYCSFEIITINPIGYLVKPYNIDDLLLLNKKIVELLPGKNDQSSYKAKNHSESSASKRVLFPTTTGFKYVAPNSILKLIASGSYTEVYLSGNNKPIIVSSNLKKLEAMLPTNIFYRPHHKFLVNTHKIHEFNKTDGGFFLLEDGSRINFSKRKKKEFLEHQRDLKLS